MSWSTSPTPKGSRRRRCRRSKPGGKREGQGAGPAQTHSSKHEGGDAGTQGPGPRPHLLPGRQAEGGLAGWTRTKPAASPAEAQSHRCGFPIRSCAFLLHHGQARRGVPCRPATPHVTEPQPLAAHQCSPDYRVPPPPPHRDCWILRRGRFTRPQGPCPSDWGPSGGQVTPASRNKARGSSQRE